MKTDDITLLLLPPEGSDDGRLTETRKLAYIDLIRGLAILMVICVHHAKCFSGPAILKIVSAYGQMGVQLFFVTSAFTMCMSASSRRNESYSKTNFYIRRYFRIAPLYYFGILLYAAVRHLTNGYIAKLSAGADTPLNVAANILFVHGFVPPATNLVVFGGWSIATEMSFYLAFPLLYLIYVTSFQRFGVIAFGTLPLLAFFGDLVVQLLVARFTHFKIQNNTFLYFNVINQIPVFLIGMSTFFLSQTSRRARTGVAAKVAAFVTLTCITRALMYAHNVVATTALASLAALSFAFLFLALQIARPKLRWLEQIGEVSFSMYIFHYLFAWDLTKRLADAGEQAGIPVLVVYFATMLLVIILTYTAGLVSKAFIEDRFIEYGRRLIRVRAARKALLPR